MRRRERLPRALLAVSIHKPVRVLLLWAALATLFSPGVARLDIETSTDSVLLRHDAPWAFYQHSQERFGGDEIIVIALEAPEPYDPSTLSEVARLTRRLEGLSGVRRVDSLASVPLIRATPEGDLSLDPAIASPESTSVADLGAIRSLVRADRIAPRILVSDDDRVFALNVLLEDGAESRYDAIFEAIEANLRGRAAWVSGVPVFRRETNRRTRSELLLFVPLTVAVIAALLAALFRSVRAVVIPLGASALGTWILVGAMGFSGTPLTVTTIILPSTLLALGCAYAMHLLCAARGAVGPSALEASLASVVLPVALSGLTTALGFVAMCWVRIDAIRYVGAFGALGVLTVLAATLTVAPAALRLWNAPIREAAFSARLRNRAAPVLVGLASRRAGPLLVAWLLATGVALVGVWRLEVETDVTRWFSPGNPVRDSYEAIRARLSGISPINVVIESHDGHRASRPEALRAIDALARYLESLPEVGRALSVADPLRQIHAGFTGERDALPDSEALVEQYLLLLESVEHLGDLITDDRTAANVPLRVDQNGSSDLLQVARAAERWWEQSGAEGFSARATGIMFEFARAEDEIAWGQLKGLAFALAAIGLILLLILRWPMLTAMALVPNAVPILILFGAMGLLGVPLDAGTVLIGSLALGIAVDDTIHVVSAYRDGRLAGDPPRPALARALDRVLPPIVYTTCVIGLGFLVLGLSDFTFTRNLGLLTSGVMVACLAADVALLPALLIRFPPRRC